MNFVEEGSFLLKTNERLTKMKCKVLTGKNT